MIFTRSFWNQFHDFISLMYLDLILIVVVISWQKQSISYNLFQMSIFHQCFGHQILTTLSENYVNFSVRRKINLCSNYISWHLWEAEVVKHSDNWQEERARAAGLPSSCQSPQGGQRDRYLILLLIDWLGTCGCKRMVQWNSFNHLSRDCWSQKPNFPLKAFQLKLLFLKWNQKILISMLFLI